MLEIIPQKTCNKCKQSFLATAEFWYKDKQAPDGLAYACKECVKAKSRKWHAENSDYAAERHHEWYIENIDDVRAYRAENAEHIAETKRNWRKNNPDKVAADKKRHYEKHKTKIFAYHRSWYARNKKRITENITPEQRAEASRRSCAWAKANPDKVADYKHKRRARMAGNGGDGFTKADKELQLRSQKGRCWWCSKSMGDDVTIDHIIAIHRGGKHDPRNIVLCHHRCNCSKKDKLPQEWAGRLF